MNGRSILDPKKEAVGRLTMFPGRKRRDAPKEDLGYPSNLELG
jgi:hypothetical protein